MMQRIYVPLPAAILEALQRYAWSEDRSPNQQAERFIREGLIREGALPEDKKPAPWQPADD